jgi:hypothetical protein
MRARSAADTLPLGVEVFNKLHASPKRGIPIKWFWLNVRRDVIFDSSQITRCMFGNMKRLHRMPSILDYTLR